MTAATLPLPLPAAPLDRAALVAWGEALGAALPAGTVLALEGDLGAGKTTLAQALCRGRGITDPVTSPTFALVHQYDAPGGRVAHCDLYRLRQPRELEALGWDDLLAGSALVIIEWPDRAAGALPPATIRLRLTPTGDGEHREVTIA